MFAYQKKIIRHIKGKKTQFEEIKQTSEPYIAGMLELSNLEFKTVMINRLLMEKVDRMQEQKGNINRKIDINKEPKKKC